MKIHRSKSFYISVFLLTITLSSNAQTSELVTEVNPPMLETSGLIILDGKLITHNDSGGQAALYELDSISGDHSRTVSVENASNVDWESICHDDEYIYIGDFGNNNGDRTNLKIYKIAIPDYLDDSDDIVSAITISFNYADQIDFTSAPFETNYDAEAMIAYGDSLYIFTKNWGDNWTNVYSLPKTEGTHAAERVDSINIEGLATGASYCLDINKVVLCGYVSFSIPFVVQIENFDDAHFSQGDITKSSLTISNGYSQQIESIAFLNNQQVYLTGEDNILGNAGLHRLSLDETSNTSESENLQSFVYPNPTSSWINISHPNFDKMELYDSNGTLTLTSSKNRVSIDHIAHGTYVLIIQSKKGAEIARTKIIIH